MGVKTYIIALLILLCFPFIYAASSSSSINWLTCGGLADGVCPYAYFETMTVINKTTVNENVTGALNVAGNVGIGTTASQHKLEVAGSMNVSGNINLSGCIFIKGEQVCNWTDVNSSSGGFENPATENLNMSLFNISNVVKILAGANEDLAQKNTVVRIGKGVPTIVGIYGNDGNDDFYVSGHSEFTKSMYVKETAFFEEFYAMRDASSISFRISRGSGSSETQAGLRMMFDNGADQMLIGIDDSNTGNQLVLAEITPLGLLRDFDHVPQTNPTLYIQSNTDPNTDNTQWISLVHNKSDGIIETGKGDLRLEPSSGLVWVQNNISYDTAFDRTPSYEGTAEEALDEVLLTNSKIVNGKPEIDHLTLPKMAQAKIKVVNRVNCSTLCMNCSEVNCNYTNNYKLLYQQKYSNSSDVICNEFCDEKITYEDGRNTGAMITVLTEAVKALNDKIKQLEARVAELEKG